MSTDTFLVFSFYDTFDERRTIYYQQPVREILIGETNQGRKNDFFSPSDAIEYAKACPSMSSRCFAKKIISLTELKYDDRGENKRSFGTISSNYINS